MNSFRWHSTPCNHARVPPSPSAFYMLISKRRCLPVHANSATQEPKSRLPFVAHTSLALPTRLPPVPRPTRLLSPPWRLLSPPLCLPTAHAVPATPFDITAALPARHHNRATRLICPPPPHPHPPPRPLVPASRLHFACICTKTTITGEVGRQQAAQGRAVQGGCRHKQLYSRGVTSSISGAPLPGLPPTLSPHHPRRRSPPLAGSACCLMASENTRRCFSIRSGCCKGGEGAGRQGGVGKRVGREGGRGAAGYVREVARRQPPLRPTPGRWHSTGEDMPPVLPGCNA